MLGPNRVRLHLNSGRSVDDLLAGRTPATQLRWQRALAACAAGWRGRSPQAEGGRQGGGMAAAARRVTAAAAGRGGSRAGEPHWLEALLQRAELY